ncbi:MAG: mechanosensitive ion channel family protein [Methanolinea sp.]|nr:mechanosensitive ion channel family protein [Methanolinea sp.]
MAEEAGLNTTQPVIPDILGLHGNFLALVVIIIGALVAIVLFFLVGWLQKRAEKTDSKIDDIVIAALGTPAVIATFLVTLYLALQVADIPPALAWIVDSKYFNAIYIILGAWALSSFAYNFISTYGHRLASATATDLDDRMVALGLLVAKYVIWFVAFLLILHTLEVDITPLLAGAGIITLALALAAQDIFSNFFGGALIAIDKPFRLNDRIQIDQYYGDVIHVGPRSTRIRTLDNQIVTIPNSKLVNNYVVNYAMPEPRIKVRLPVSVAYGSDVKKVREVLLDIARDAAKEYSFILTEPRPIVYFLEFGASSLNFQLVVWCNDFSLTFETKDALNMMIADRFAQEGIEIPFPQMDVHIKDKP